MTTTEILDKGYDHIVATVICQNRLLSKELLWGDGTIYGSNRELFEQLYSTIAEMIKNNELCEVN